jgi:hypothetical protein
MSHRLKITLLVSALVIVNTSLAAGRAARHAEVESGSPEWIEVSSKREPARGGAMRDVLTDDAHGSKRVPTGMWGGKHVGMTVAESSATVEFDCAHATIPRRIVLDRHGRFDVAGTYAEEHGGPVRPGEQSGGHAARFTGRVTGKTMRLTVARADTKKIVGTFTLAHGREASLVKCR